MAGFEELVHSLKYLSYCSASSECSEDTTARRTLLGSCCCHLPACSAMLRASKIVQISPEIIEASFGNRYTCVPSLEITAGATADPSLEASVYIHAYPSNAFRFSQNFALYLALLRPCCPAVVSHSQMSPYTCEPRREMVDS